MKKFCFKFLALLLLSTLLVSDMATTPIHANMRADNESNDTVLLTNVDTVRYVKEGHTFKLEANQDVTYSCSNTKVATVSTDGKITGKKIGETQIKVTAKSDATKIQYLNLYIISTKAKTYRYANFKTAWKKINTNYPTQEILFYPGSRLYINNHLIIGPKGTQAMATAWANTDEQAILGLQGCGGIDETGKPFDFEGYIALWFYNGRFDGKEGLFWKYINDVIDKRPIKDWDSVNKVQIDVSKKYKTTYYLSTDFVIGMTKYTSKTKPSPSGQALYMKKCSVFLNGTKIFSQDNSSFANIENGTMEFIGYTENGCGDGGQPSFSIWRSGGAKWVKTKKELYATGLFYNNETDGIRFQ